MLTRKLLLLAFALSTAFIAHAQVPPAVSAEAMSANYVLEIQLADGRPIAFQKLGHWVWFGVVKTLSGRPVTRDSGAFKFFTIAKQGSVTVIVSLLSGPNLSKETDIAQYELNPDSRELVKELAKYDIPSPTIALARSPARVGPFPALVNKTKSLDVTLDTANSPLPSFYVKFTNNSAVPINYLSFEITSNGRNVGSSSNFNPEGAPLIEPGKSFERILAYPLEDTVRSTGQLPSEMPGLLLTVSSSVSADGKWDGNPAMAALYFAKTRGEWLQLQKILALFRQEISSPQQFRELINSVLAEVDPAELAKVTAMLDKPGKGDEKLLATFLTGGVTRTRALFMKEVSSEPAATFETVEGIRSWIDRSKERYQKWSDALSKLR